MLIGGNEYNVINKEAGDWSEEHILVKDVRVADLFAVGVNISVMFDMGGIEMSENSVLTSVEEFNGRIRTYKNFEKSMEDVIVIDPTLIVGDYKLYMPGTDEIDDDIFSSWNCGNMYLTNDSLITLYGFKN